ncbi:MAG: VCBS repeat-containing protein [Planctomycetota bacterium]
MQVPTLGASLHTRTTGAPQVAPRRRRASVLVFGSLCALAVSPSTAAQGPFEAWRAFSVGDAAGSASAPTLEPAAGLHPSAAALGDLNGDGRPDLAVVSWFQAPTLSVSLATDKGLAAPVHYASPAAQAVLMADVDGDGDLDLVVSEFGNNGEVTTLAVHRNQGDGTLAAPTRTVVGQGLRGLAAGDFDRDGDIDIAVARHGGNVAVGTTVSVLLNSGTGTFPSRVTVPAADPTASPFAIRPWRIAAGDMDADGDLDLVVACGVQRLSVLRNDTPAPGGALQFAPAVTHSIPGAIPDVDSGVALLDLDGDGDLDVAYSSASTRMNPPGATSPGAVALFSNDGLGGLGPALLAPTTSFSVGHAALTAADFDADGYDDLAVITASGFATLKNRAAPFVSTASLGPGTWRACGEAPCSVLAGDSDLDGALDLWTVDAGSATASIHRNEGQMTFPPAPTFDHGNIGQRDLALGDLDGDGDLDVALVGGLSGFGGVLRVSRNAGDGTFSAPTNYSTPRAGRRVQLVDLDVDGDLDLAWIDDPDGPPYDLETRLNDGTGSFGPQQSWTLSTCGSWDLTLVDVDSDGDPDAVVAEALNCFGSVQNSLYVAENVGGGAFAAPVLLADGAWGVAGGDLDGDGDVDLVTATTFGVDVRMGVSGGGFAPPTTITLPEGQRRVRLADLDGDGALDVVTQQQRSTESAAVWILMGDGAGGFASPQRHRAAYSRDFNGTNSMDIADVDGDGDLDVVVANGASSDISLLRNDGLGGFTPHERFGAAGSVLDVDLGDVTGDGVPDAVVLGTIANEGSRYGFSVLAGAANGAIGASECGPAALNASGRRGVISATGFPTLLANNIVLRAEGLTQLAFGYFIASRDAGLVVMPGGSAGTLCLGGSIGRVVGGAIANTGAAGSMAANVDALSMPSPTGSVAVAPGETWRFQCWFRDASPAGSATSNFTDAIAIRFE